MPTYTVTDPDSGKVVKLTGDTPPTEQELNEIFSNISGGEQPQQEKQAQSTEQAIDQRIANRPSMMSDLMEKPPLETFTKHPVGTTLRTLLGAAELMQGAGASTALDLQRGRPQDILPNLNKVLQGQRPAEYGDVFRGAGMPETAAATAGLATDLALSPGGANLIAATPKLLGKGVNLIKGILKWDSALKQAKNSKVALDTVRAGLGKAKEIALSDVGNLPVEFDFGSMPTKVYNAIRSGAKEYDVAFDAMGKPVQTLRNMDKLKLAADDLLSRKDFVEAGNILQGKIKQFAGAVRNAIVKTANDAGKPELGKALTDYHEFMKNYGYVNRSLVDEAGNAMANRLKNTFKLGAEPAIKQAWKEVSKASPGIKSTMNSMKRREILKNLLKVSGATALATGAAKGLMHKD